MSVRKNFIFFIIVSITCLLLPSCTKQEVNNGLYGIISLPLFAAFVYFFLQAKKGYNSGYTQQTKNGIVSGESKVIPWGRLFFAIVFLLASIGSAKWIYEENRNYDPKKDGIPKEAPNDNRESAEDQAAKADSVYRLNK